MSKIVLIFQFQTYVLLLDEGAKPYKISKDTYNWGGWLNLDDLLNERVAEGVASNVNVFNAQQT